jgi:hypothetical protein
VLFLLGACSGRAVEGSDPVILALAEVEGHLARRVDPNALEEGIAQGWTVLHAYPDDERVLEALARGYYARGYRQTGQAAIDDFTQAYQLSRRCLAGNSGWQSRLEVAGGRVVADVTARLRQSDLPCLDITLLALGHRISARGPAGWVDIRELALLAEAANLLDPESRDWVPPWATGLSLTVAPQAGSEDLQQGAAAFLEANQREPGLMTAVVDRLTYVLSRRQDRPSFVKSVNAVRNRYTPVLRSDPWALENQRGMERLNALLE